jgi:hypothetical protein
MPAYRRPNINNPPAYFDKLSYAEQQRWRDAVLNRTFMLAVGPFVDLPGYSIGTLGDKRCSVCDAMFFNKEVKGTGPFWCCNHGRTPVEPREYPENLKELFVGNTPGHKRNRDALRHINSSLALAAIEHKRIFPQGRGPLLLKVQGQISVTMGPIDPPGHPDNPNVRDTLADKDRRKNGQLIAITDPVEVCCKKVVS